MALRGSLEDPGAQPHLANLRQSLLTSEGGSLGDEAEPSNPVLAAPPPLSRSYFRQSSRRIVTQSADLFREQFALGAVIGKGVSSVVVRGRHNATGTCVAVKIVRTRDLTDSIRDEISVLTRVKHPNCVKLLHTVNDYENDRLLIVMELAEGGELFDRIVEKGSYNESDAVHIIRTVADVLLYLHERGIVHRDLKPQNLLLRSKKSDTDICVCDFGLSQVMTEDARLSTMVGTPAYVAPEMLQGRGYGKEVDLWALGVITYILLSGFEPFASDDVSETFALILQGNVDFPDEDGWKSVSSGAKDFICKLLIQDPLARLTAKQCLEHSWLKPRSKPIKLKTLVNLRISMSRLSRYSCKAVAARSVVVTDEEVADLLHNLAEPSSPLSGDGRAGSVESGTATADASDNAQDGDPRRRPSAP